MVINVNSESFCRKAYLNYHCYGNTMGLSAEDMGKITQAWSSKISSWQATVSSDENEYEFDDSEYSKFVAEGRKEGEKVADYDGKTGGAIAQGVGDATSALGGLAVNTFVKGSSGKLMVLLGAKGSETAAKGAKIIGGVAVKSGASEAGEKALSKSLSWSISAPLALATAIAYMANKANKEGKVACDKLQTEMGSAQMLLSETQNEMDVMSDEIMNLSDEANMVNEDTNDDIEDQKTEFDMYMKTFLAIQEKVDAGEQLTDSEKQLYEEVMGYMAEISTYIEETSSDTTDEVADLYDEIGTYQEGYDIAAESMGQIEGLTDYAESFDSTTQTMCYVEGAAQTLNAASGGWAGVQAGLAAAASMGFNAWAWACAAMGASASVMSGIASAEQFQWAGEVGTEIEMRKTTQDINADTMDIYTEEIDSYAGFMQGVEDLELEIPDDLEAPEASGNINGTENAEGTESTEYTSYTEILEEMEEGSKIVTENQDGSGAVMIAPQYGTAIANALGLPSSSSGGKFGKDAIPKIIAQLAPGYSPEEILKVMNGGSIETSYQASLIQTPTGEDTGKDKTINNSGKSTENLQAVIRFYKPIFVRASQQGWKC